MRAFMALLAITAACDSTRAARGPRVIAGAPDPGAASCLPRGDGWGVRDQLGRIGDDLVVCVSGADALRGCWTLDPMTGAVRARETVPIPGAGFPVKDGCYRGACSTAAAPRAPEPGAAIVALHPDGKRVAVLDGGRLTVLDVAGRRVLTSFLLRGDQAGDDMIGNAPTNLWFVGETIYIRGDDAGPSAVLIPYDLAGRAHPVLARLYHGGVGVDGRSLLVQEEGLSSLRVVDGVRAHPVRTRRVPPGACAPEELAEWEAMGDDPEQDPCLAYLGAHYRPYEGAQLVTAGKELVCFTGSHVVVLDGKTLAEQRRVEVVRCGADPDHDGP